jgi:3-phosphoshikimate 1-carboxyvinyltransferase
MLRFLAAACAARPGNFRLDGSPRLRERPLGPLLDALRALGAAVVCEQRSGFAPLRVDGATLRGGAARLDASASSQFLSALLLAGQCAAAPIELVVDGLTSAPYVELTLQLIRDWGGRAERDAGGNFRLHPSPIGAARAPVEADASAACYAAAAAALPGGRVEVRGLRHDTAQGDAGFFAVLERMGAAVTRGPNTIAVEGGALQGVDVDLSGMPDQVPTLAALAPFARGETVLRNIPHLRWKESDRLAAMTALLRAAGATVRESADGLAIDGTWSPGSVPADPVVVDPVDDHRIAMSAAVLGVGRPNLLLRHPRVVAKSYPAFWQDWRQLVHP